MKNYYLAFLLLLSTIFLPCSLHAQGQFTSQVYAEGFDQVIGITFDANGRMFVWEKAGRIWIVEDGKKSSSPFLDISDEVGNWRDFGMLSVALDPNFLTNGYVYLYYLVDRHHLLNTGSPGYDPEFNEYFSASQGRVTRYQATASSAYTEVDENSRKVLIGEEIGEGFPSLHESHMGGSLIFGQDGTLLVTVGDAGSYLSNDQGSAPETYYAQALADGIISQEENIGSYRCQVLFSYSGKLLRIDPETGLGIPSNPFYDPENPDAPASKVWGRGLRNPFRMTHRPGTGSHYPEDGDPGSFYIGDVGAGTREEINVSNEADQNFGWPRFEGMDFEPGFWDFTYFPENHSRPKLDWRNCTPRASIDNEIVLIGPSATVSGPSYQGNCSMGGAWYTADDFPPEYKNTYFFIDYGAQWIKNATFDENDNPVSVRNVLENVGSITYIETSPTNGGLYYVNNASLIWRVSFEDILSKPPVAIAEADTLFGGDALTVSFQGDRSFDPEFFPVKYSWNFGDGSLPVGAANPTHTFTSTNPDPISYLVTLSVFDREGNVDSTSLRISLNNHPPQILSTSLDTVSGYTLQAPKELVLEAELADVEDVLEDLEVSWQVILFHNDHFHPEPVEKAFSTVTFLSPVGCEEDATYWYRVLLRVTDSDGLTSSYQKDIFPDCGRNEQAITFDPIPDLSLDQETYMLSGRSSAGLPLTYFIVDGPASVTGNMLNLQGSPGQVTVRAIQAGNEQFNPAVALERTFTVFPGPPELVITFPAEGDAIVGSDIELRYDIFGNLAGADADHIHVKLDDESEIAWHELNGRYILRDLRPGAHTLTVSIVTDTDESLENPQSSMTVNFSSIPGAAGTGLTGTYYEGIGFEEIVFTRVDPEINFNWGNESPAPERFNDFFSIRWEGTLEVPITGEYTFLTTNDDGARLWVKDQQLIDAWRDQPATLYEGKIFLEAQERVPIVLEYYERGGAATVRLQWEHASIPREVIPATYLYPIGGKAMQRISFSYLSDRKAEIGSFPIEVYATSGLPVSLQVDGGPASLDGNVLELSGEEGSVRITASQVGNEVFAAAAAVKRTFQVKAGLGPANLSILQPQNLDTLIGPSIEVGIDVEGDLLTDNITHLYLYVDNRPPITIYDFPDTYTLTNLESGRHTLRAVLLTEDHQEIAASTEELTFWVAAIGRDCVALRSAWQSQDIGNVGLTGQSCQFNDVFVISGAGEDIWEQEDGFQFAFQELSGDAAIIAQITQLTNTDPWAKAGLMIRNSLDNNAANAFLALTAENDGIFQNRRSVGEFSQASYFTENIPYWLRLERRGDVLIGFASEEGAFWEQVGIAYVPLSEDVYVGLAMTSHNNNSLGTATFENVQLTTLDPGNNPQKNAPAILLAERQMDKHLYLGWEATDPNEWGFLIERAVEGSTSFEVVYTAGNNDRYWVDTEAEDDQTYTYRLRSISEGGLSPYSEIAEVSPQNILCDVLNVTAFGATVTASSELNEFLPAGSAIDGNLGTYWEASFMDNNWIRIDLGAEYAICSVVARWIDDSYPGDFSIRTSLSGLNFQTARNVIGNVSANNTIRFENVKTRYLSLEASRIVTANYKLRELEIYTPDKMLSFNEDQLWVYPNPMEDHLHVSMRVEEPKVVIIQLLDLAGRKVSTWVEKLVPGYNDLDYDITNISGGYYLLKIRTQEEQIFRKINIFD